MADPIYAFEAMDVFLLTSRAEGLPNVVIEAQAHWIAVVSTDIGDAAETFRDGVSGRLLNSDDAAVLARVVLEVLHDRKWRANARGHRAPVGGRANFRRFNDSADTGSALR